MIARIREFMSLRTFVRKTYVKMYKSTKKLQVRYIYLLIMSMSAVPATNSHKLND